jgi:hypothetical protein
METLNENWKELFIADELDRSEMFRIRGGGDPDPGDPGDPIIK